MSNETLNLAINTSGLDVAQAKADRLLATLRLIKDAQVELPIDSTPPLLAELQKISSGIEDVRRQASVSAERIAPLLLR